MSKGTTKRAIGHVRRHAIAYLALFVAVGGGTAVAAKKIKLPRNSVGAKQIKAGAVDSTKVKDGSLKPADLAAGTIPAASTPEVVEATIVEPASNSSDVLLASPAGLGEIRGNCNTSVAGGAAILGYDNTAAVPVHLVQEGLYDTDLPDQKDFESSTVAPGVENTGSFTNYGNPQRHEIDLISDEASPKAATVTVAVFPGGGNCKFHVVTLGS